MRAIDKRPKTACKRSLPNAGEPFVMPHKRWFVIAMLGLVWAGPVSAQDSPPHSGAPEAASDALIVDEGVLELEPEPGSLFVFPGEGGAQREAETEAYRALGLNPEDFQEEAEGGGSAPTVAPTGPVLRVGFLPALPAAQLFVISENDMGRRYGFDVIPRQFVTARALNKALAEGDIHLAIQDGGQVLAAWEAGHDPTIIAAAAMDSVGLYATGRTAALLESADPADALRKYSEATGNRISIAAIDETSSAAAALNIWAFDTMRLTADELRIPTGDLIPVWRAMLRGRMMAVLAPEPLLTSLMAQDGAGRVVMDGVRLMEGQPTAVVSTDPTVVQARRDQLKNYLRLHREATRLLRDDPGAAASAAARYAGFNRLRAPDMAVALRARFNRFVDDPRLLIEPMAVMADYLRRRGHLFREAPPHDVINDSLFREVAAETPLDPILPGDPAEEPPMILGPG